MFKKWIAAAQVYFDRRMLIMMGLGFSSGFPLLLVFGTLSLWLKSAGLSLAAIGIFSLVKIPYSFKWVWSPIVDRVRLPFFEKLGRRRGWALFSQICMMFSILGMASANPSESPHLMAFYALFVAFFSATQDIVLDAYRVETFKTKEQGAGAAIFVLGYRFGLVFSGAVALLLVSIFSWNEVYFMMGMGAFVGIITILIAHEPKEKVVKTLSKKAPFIKRAKNFLETAMMNPFKDFIKRPDWALILLFVMLYRLSDSYMGPMAMPFYDDMGFSTKQIAFVSKGYGMVATIVGGLLGGVMVSRYGLLKSLIWGGVLQGVTNLLFVLQAELGNNIYMLAVTISCDNIAGGLGGTAFVAYLSSLCNRAYTATQYALLSSFMSIARDILSATSGYAAGILSWNLFFVLTTFMALPSLMLIWLINKRYPIKNNVEF